MSTVQAIADEEVTGEKYLQSTAILFETLRKAEEACQDASIRAVDVRTRSELKMILKVIGVARIESERIYRMRMGDLR